MAGPPGFEPGHDGVKVRCLTAWLRANWWRGTDSNRRTLRERIYSPPRLASSLPLQNGGLGRNRTADTRIFSPLLYRLSYQAFLNSILKLAELTGLEPATSGVTDRRELQLHHSSIQWCRLKDLNPQPPDYKSGALPIELSRLFYFMVGADGIEPPTPCL